VGNFQRGRSGILALAFRLLLVWHGYRAQQSHHAPCPPQRVGSSGFRALPCAHHGDSRIPSGRGRNVPLSPCLQGRTGELSAADAPASAERRNQSRRRSLVSRERSPWLDACHRQPPHRGPGRSITVCRLHLMGDCAAAG